ncbi:SDR family NAD(P)-dependent oxidoreductase [Tenggerimyces flavus]|uniref:SDR family NAD(P)-dependent oxidoreductase n=1 Tax=Tenggerimyces flavus TaxID=1708749 RepID=A0ABV7Y8S6_9ACTN|nr:SDR family NAD(P)-dependent oxidoreductase [Tenggerimyces flavus]MBM7783515.1 NAD(P)-dependent dehydrogenase (short-subunit alcohol dehydrogenase family) [Tenggerimyces flavus]
MPTIAIVGAGPLLGLSVAKLFGAKGFQVALVSRTRENLNARVAELSSLGVEAAGFAGDATTPESLAAAFAEIRARFGEVDVLVFNAVSKTVTERVVAALDVSADNLREQIDVQLYGAVTSARQVLPSMLTRGEGTLLFSSAITAVHPTDQFTNFGIGGAALRYYVATLNTSLADKGIHAAHISVGVQLNTGPGTEPDTVAQQYWDAYVGRDQAERLYYAA